MLLQVEKLRLLTGSIKPQAQPAFEPLLEWVKAIIMMFAESTLAALRHQSEKFDHATGGGIITLDRFQSILDIDIAATTMGEMSDLGLGYLNIE
jgi:hypothetical protein